MDARELEQRTHPAEFRKWYRIPTDDGPRPWIEVADPQQIADHDVMIPGILRAMGRPAEGGPSSAYLERPRAGGKTTDMALCGNNILAGSRQPCRGLAYAQGKDQARLLRDAGSDGIRCTPGLDKLLSVQAYRTVNQHNGGTLDIMSSDVASSWGPTPNFILVDELTHWVNELLWDSLVTSAGKVRDCLLIVGSNAGLGKGSSWHWRRREQFRVDPDLYFGRFESPPARITPERLAQQERLVTKSTFRRVWLNEWLAEAGDALDSADIEKAIVLAGPMDYREDGYSYVGGLDLGIRHDHSAFVVIGCDHAEHRMKLTLCESWKPPKGGSVDLGEVRGAVLAAKERFGMKGVLYDPWQCEFLSQTLRDDGLTMEPVTFTGQNLNELARTLLDTFRSQRLDLYRDDGLIEDLQRLLILERPYGYKLEVARTAEGGHGDKATALAIALPTAAKVAAVSLVPFFERVAGRVTSEGITFY